MVDPVSRLQIMAVNNPVDPDNENVHQKGDIVSLIPGNIQPGASEGLPNRVWVNITNGDHANHRAYWESWESRLNYAKLSLDSAQDLWRITVFMTNVNSSNRGGLTKQKVDAELGLWNISSDTTQFAPNQVRFDAKVYDVARSSAVLGGTNQAALDQISWSEDSYNESTGEHVIRGDYSATAFTENQINQALINVDVVSHDTTGKVAVYRVFRNDLFQQFKDNGEDRLNDRLGKSRYKISAADVDAIVGAGGMIDRTQAQVVASLIDRHTL